MIKRAMDIGRSRTRIYGADAQDGFQNVKSMQIEKKKVRLFDSVYKEIPATADNRYDAKSKIEDFIITGCPIKELEGRRFVRGETADYHRGSLSQADNQLKKFEQLETFVNVTYALASDLISTGSPSTMFGPDIVLGMCVPCGEFFSSGAEKMKEKIAGLYTVDFPLLGASVAFRLTEDNITIMPEGVVAVYILPKEKRLESTKGRTVAILDCGYGSLDITLLRNGRPIGETSRSFPIGGVTLEALVSSELETNNIFTSVTNVTNAIETGFVEVGSTRTDVTNIVNLCKKRLASGIVKSLKQVVVQSMISDAEINSICPIGRCFTHSNNLDGDLATLVESQWRYKVNIIDLSDAEYGLEAVNVLGVYKALD